MSLRTIKLRRSRPWMTATRRRSGALSSRCCAAPATPTLTPGVQSRGAQLLSAAALLGQWAICQRRWEPQAQAYYAKKRAEGKTERAAMRCLKRRLVDVVFRLLAPFPQEQIAEDTPLAA